jgi:hypothetical protein
MGKEFQRKYMHPTRRKLADMIKTGEYDKNTQIGYDKVQETRNVGDIWEDDHHKYEKKEGYTLKTGKNSEAFSEIRKYIEEKSKCKNSDCKKIKKSEKDKKMIEKGGYCLNCTIDREHQIKTSGFWVEYEDYKIATRMLIYGKIKLDSYRHSIDELKEEYQMIGSDGKVVETWKLPKPIEEVRNDILELIKAGEEELKQIEQKRLEAFDILKQNNLEHYL